MLEFARLAYWYPLDHPQVSGTTLPFLTVFGPIWLFVGCWSMAVGSWWRLAVGSGWRLMAVGDCQLAVGSYRVGKGGTPSARDQGADRTCFGLLWAILGHYGPLPACRSPIRGFGAIKGLPTGAGDDFGPQTLRAVRPYTG